MALVLLDRVKETTTTTGTGTITLAGAAPGFQAFSAIGNGNQTYYAIVDNVAGTWEVGIGTYTASGTTLSRTEVLSSSNSGNLVNFAAGSKDVFVTYPAEKAIYEEVNGDTLINAGPITVFGAGTTPVTPFTNTFGRFYANTNSFAQIYVQNQNSGSDASSDIVAYSSSGDGTDYFVDTGINSPNYSSAYYTIFAPNDAYLYCRGAAAVASRLLIGTESPGSDIVMFTGGVTPGNTKMVIKDTTGNVLVGTTTDAGQKLQVAGSARITGATTFGSTVTLNADPASALQAATKQYVDSAVSTGFVVHTPVRLATTAALTGTVTYNNGTAGVGATITLGTALTTLDGVSLNNGDRVLIKNETSGNAPYNGVYTWATGGTVLTRATDFDTAAPGEIANNAYFFITEGTANAGSSYVLSQTAAITVGTTALPFTEFSDQLSYVSGTNIDVTGLTISLTGTVAATNGGTGTNTVTTGDLLYGSASNVWSKLPLGLAYKSLIVNAAGTQLEWNAIPLNQSAAVSGALGAANGGTGQTTYAVGDTLYSGATNTLAKLSGNITTTKQYLSQTGTGSVSQAPSWATIAAADVTGLAASATTDTTNAANITTGTLPSARLDGAYGSVTGVGTLTSGVWNATAITAGFGGTGQSTYAVGDILYASATTPTLSKLTIGTTGQVLTVAGGVPTWATSTAGDVTTGGIQTLTNKRITPRVSTPTVAGTYAIDTDSFDMVVITGQNVTITSITTTGTPTNGQKLWVSITGTASRLVTFSTSNFESSTVTLPITTVGTNRLDVGFVWNVATSKWRCVAVA